MHQKKVLSELYQLITMVGCERYCMVYGSYLVFHFFHTEFNPAENKTAVTRAD